MAEEIKQNPAPEHPTVQEKPAEPPKPEEQMPQRFISIVFDEQMRYQVNGNGFQEPSIPVLLRKIAADLEKRYVQGLG